MRGTRGRETYLSTKEAGLVPCLTGRPELKVVVVRVRDLLLACEQTSRGTNVSHRLPEHGGLDLD